MFHSQSTLGDLAAQGSHVRSVLLRYQLDFCCGGKRALGTACESAGIDADRVLADIAAVAQAQNAQEEDWQRSSLPRLIEHIVQRYHQPLPQQFDGVIAAAEKVEGVHGAKPTCPQGLAEHLRALRHDLMEHMTKEEQVLFPAIIAGQRGGGLSAPVIALMQEHDDAGDALRRTRAITGDLKAPKEACATWRALYEELERFEADLMTHVHLENHVLFPRALEAD